jgi:hypothetical protein
MLQLPKPALLPDFYCIGKLFLFCVVFHSVAHIFFVIFRPPVIVRAALLQGDVSRNA